MKNILTVLSVVFVLFTSVLARADRPIEVTLYCRAPSIACGAAWDHLESNQIDFRTVYAWESGSSLGELSMITHRYGIHVSNSDTPIIKINDSVVVGILYFDEVYRMIFNNRP